MEEAATDNFLKVYSLKWAWFSVGKYALASPLPS